MMAAFKDRFLTFQIISAFSEGSGGARGVDGGTTEVVADAADYAEMVCTAITSDIDIISSFF